MNSNGIDYEHFFDRVDEREPDLDAIDEERYEMEMADKEEAETLGITVEELRRQRL